MMIANLLIKGKASALFRPAKSLTIRLRFRAPVAALESRAEETAVRGAVERRLDRLRRNGVRL